jgi:hypothetical protein
MSYILVNSSPPSVRRRRRKHRGGSFAARRVICVVLSLVAPKQIKVPWSRRLRLKVVCCCRMSFSVGSLGLFFRALRNRIAFQFLLDAISRFVQYWYGDDLTIPVIILASLYGGAAQSSDSGGSALGYSGLKLSLSLSLPL